MDEARGRVLQASEWVASMQPSELKSRVAASAFDSLRCWTGVVVKNSTAQLIGLGALWIVLPSSLWAQVPTTNRASRGLPVTSVALPPLPAARQGRLPPLGGAARSGHWADPERAVQVVAVREERRLLHIGQQVAPHLCLRGRRSGLRCSQRSWQWPPCRWPAPPDRPSIFTLHSFKRKLVGSYIL